MKCQMHRSEKHVQRDETDHADVIIPRQERIGACSEMVPKYWARAENDQGSNTKQQYPAVKLLGYRKT